MGRHNWPEQLVIVRHGESEKNLQREIAKQQGHPDYGVDVRDADVRLTPTGIQQAEHTGRYLATFPPFYRVCVSPYQRTIETAEAIGRQLGYAAEFRCDERLREREHGIMDGLTNSGFKEKNPDEFARREKEGRYYYRPPGGESYPDVNLRVYSFLSSIRQNYAGRHVLVVAHAIVIWAFQKTIDRLTEKQILPMINDPDQDICNCAVSVYQYDDSAGRLTMRSFNAVRYPHELAVSDACKKKALGREGT